MDGEKIVTWLRREIGREEPVAVPTVRETAMKMGLDPDHACFGRWLVITHRVSDEER